MNPKATTAFLLAFHDHLAEQGYEEAVSMGELHAAATERQGADLDEIRVAVAAGLAAAQKELERGKREK